MCEEYVEKPLYLLIADWVMAEKRWVSAKEIAKHFNMDHCKAINTVSYILAEVGDINCETKTILINWQVADVSVSDWSE